MSSGVCSGYHNVCLTDRQQLSHGIQTGKNNENPTIIKESRQRMHLHLLVGGNTWAGPSNPRAGPLDCRAGPYRVRVLSLIHI